MLTISTALPRFRPDPCNPNEHCKAADGLQLSVLYLSLYLIALGTGGLKSSVSGFGADQFDENDEKEGSQMDYFFNRFFLCISLVSLLAVTVLVYIQDHVGRPWGYGICVVCMMVAIIIFLGGTRTYRFKKTTGRPLTQILQVFVASWRNRKLKLPADVGQLHDDNKASLSHRMVPHTDQFR
jgi:dipeptide/tripeptide permease